jgi:hypothetical protein
MAFDLVQYFSEQIKLQKPQLFDQYSSKERLYFIENVKVNGSQCDTIQEFELVITNLELRQDFEGLAEIWGEAFENTKFANQRNFYTEIRENVTRLLNLINIISEYKSKITEIPTLRNKKGRITSKEIESLLFEVEYNKLYWEVERLKEEVNKSRAVLTDINIHPIKNKILDSFESIDLNLYKECLSELNEIKKYLFSNRSVYGLVSEQIL